MTDTFRALFAELADALDSELDLFETRHSALLDRARAALAEGAGVGVTDEELDKTLFQALDEYMRQKSPFGGPTDQKQLDRAKARAVLARYGTHPRPIPVGERLEALETLARDAVSALRYIEQQHGRLYGVGWDRVFDAAAAIPLPEA